jgi:hypothetical protein
MKQGTMQFRSSSSSAGERGVVVVRAKVLAPKYSRQSAGRAIKKAFLSIIIQSSKIKVRAQFNVRGGAGGCGRIKLDYLSRCSLFSHSSIFFVIGVVY